MPFTASHPAAVLPLLGTALPSAALVIGAMVPDLPYYVPLPVSSSLSHSWAGVVTIDVILGLVCVGLWYLLAVPFLLAAAPSTVRQRVPGTVLRPLRTSVGRWELSSRVGVVLVGLGLVVMALAVGAATHVLWDSFTHPNRWGSTAVPWLGETHAGQPGWQWAQWSSGVLGAAVLVWWGLRWWRRSAAREVAPELPPQLSRGVVLVVVGVVLAIGVVGAATVLVQALDAGHDVDHALFLAFTRGAGITAAAAVVVMLGFQLSRSRTARARHPHDT